MLGFESEWEEARRMWWEDLIYHGWVSSKLLAAFLGIVCVLVIIDIIRSYRRE